MTTITWNITEVQCKPTDSGLNNVVISAKWACNGVNEEHEGFVIGSSAFSPPDPASFTPYELLTETQILDWCWSSGIHPVDKTAIEFEVNLQINKKMYPQVITPTLPWVTE